MFYLRLGVHRWGMIDRRSIEAMFLGSSSHRDFAWQLVDEPPFDALLILRPRSQKINDFIDLDQTSTVVSIVCTSGKFHTLEMPLRTDQLKCSLMELQSEFEYGYKAVGYRPDLEEAADTARLMLKCWPPASLLDNDPDRVQLAALLLERKVKFVELVELSGQTPIQCALFVSVLDQAGLLERYAELPSASQPAAPRSKAEPSLSKTLTHMISVLFRKQGKASESPGVF